jgi:4-hydroxybenzoate polyprenyltransferase
MRWRWLVGRGLLAAPPDPLALAALLPMALASRLAGGDARACRRRQCARRFRSNRNAGLLMFAACFVVGQTL